MPPFTLALVAAAAAITAAVSFFSSGKSTDDDRPGSGSAPSSGPTSSSRTRPSYASPPPPSTSRGQTTNRTPTYSSDHSRYSHHLSDHPPTTHTAGSRLTPSASSTRAQPSYQQQPVYTRAAQATAKAKESVESSDHIHCHGLAASRQTLPTSASHSSHASYSAQPTTPIGNAPSTTSDYSDLLKLHRASRPSSHAGEPRKPPPTSDYLDRLERYRDSLSSYTRESRQTPQTAWDSPLTPSTPARTHASYAAQQTSARAGQTTVRTPAVVDYDGGMRRSGLTSSDTNESHVVHPTTSPLSSYSYQRAPSPDAARRVRVSSRLTVSPQKKHSRTHSSSSDSDYLSPSSHARASAAWSYSPDAESDDPVANAENEKKAQELRIKARRSNLEMRDARDRAKDARRRGDRVAESEYNQEARAHESAMKNSDKIAAKLIFKVKNQRQEEGTVDLHSLYVKEAVEYAKEELQSAMYRDDDTVSFIVGKGLHAENGVSKLRPALEELFDERRLRYSLDPENSGVLIVYLY